MISWLVWQPVLPFLYCLTCVDLLLLVMRKPWLLSSNLQPGKNPVKQCVNYSTIVFYIPEFVLHLSPYIPRFFHDKIRNFHDLLVPNQRVCHVCIRILPGILHFALGQNVIFVVYFHFPWLFHDILHLIKIFLTSPGLELNSMTFPGFPWPHEPLYTLS